ncbi:MAG: bifunctional adenosylcobinamide kinase/adenosylcobinamide-phosphate guanylyltransferase [Deltaproteobacteria bacterium]|jgi:adenosylcobinamide kinase/adenosylcobinamide-phosphate guanylyltransferase|nr:bifunctional adenosylcobinamide kinase/adenosylcobinamide-phosphate guanylyltransferase [Deltaproteobacteria bacterium]
MGRLTLFLGGAKSGKTKAALALASKHAPPRFYLATAEGLDGEMRERIKNHQAERGPEWRTLEEPLDPCQALQKLNGKSVVLFDCLTLWFSNLLLKYPDYDLLCFEKQTQNLLSAIQDYSGPVILVSNELGSGIVPMEPISRLYRDAVGQAHQLLAASAHRVFLVVAGLPLKIK